MNIFDRKYLRKVPEITALFWIVKLLTTAMGESTSDYLIHVFDPVIVVIVSFCAFLLIVSVQLLYKKYVPFIYWGAALMVAVFGTMAADVIHVVLGVPYLISTIGFGLILGLVFYVWKKSEGTLSIHSIYTLRRELFYWGAIVTTFALGTAAGDLTATTLGLGYLLSIVLFFLIIHIPLIGYYKFKFNEVFAFWFAYIVTRPLGASIADWFGKPQSVGGLGVGSGVISIILGILILISLVYLTFDQKRKS